VRDAISREKTVPNVSRIVFSPWILRIHYKKNAILRRFLSHFAGVFNLRGLFCESFENRRLFDSHKLSVAVFRDRWYMVKTPENLRRFFSEGSKPPQNRKNK
jgi:hypothetical protein